MAHRDREHQRIELGRNTLRKRLPEQGLRLLRDGACCREAQQFMLEAPEQIRLENCRRRIARLRAFRTPLPNEQIDQLLSILHAARVPLESQAVDPDVFEGTDQTCDEPGSPVDREIGLANMIGFMKKMTEAQDGGFIVFDGQRRQVNHVAIGARSGFSDFDLRSHLAPKDGPKNMERTCETCIACTTHRFLLKTDASGSPEDAPPATAAI